MKKTFLKGMLLTIPIALILGACGVAERSETKSEENSNIGVKVETDTVSQPNTVAEGIKLEDFVPKQKFTQAGFEQINPKNRHFIKPGEVHFEFNTKKFPFVDGHSVRIAVENGTEKFIFDAQHKVSLPKGVFLCASYLCDGNGICLKNSKSFVLTQLNIGVEEKKEIDLKQPMIFLNSPAPMEGKNPLIDFMLFNTELSKTGNKVRVSVDDDTELYLDEWKSMKIIGLKPGKHKILIELINAKGQLYDGVYANDASEFVVRD